MMKINDLRTGQEGVEFERWSAASTLSASSLTVSSPAWTPRSMDPTNEPHDQLPSESESESEKTEYRLTTPTPPRRRTRSPSFAWRLRARTFSTMGAEKWRVRRCWEVAHEARRPASDARLHDTPPGGRRL